MIEERTLFERNLLTVVATMEEDRDSSPTDRDFENAEQEREIVGRFNDGNWIFVGMIVSVRWQGREIGEASLWGIEHGTYMRGVEANAWELIPARREEPNVVVMGSPLSSVVDEALSNADEWVQSLAGDAGLHWALTAAHQWADPATAVVPDRCPKCGKDLRAEGFPIAHQSDPDGEVCPMQVDGSGRLVDKEAHPTGGGVRCRCGYEASSRADLDEHVAAVMAVADGQHHGER